MKGPKDLLANEDRWNTRMGLVFPGERVVFRGKDLFHELKDMRWMELLLFGITGRRFDEKQVRLFEGIWVLCTSYPDPRIWNNRAASLAGTARSTTTLAVSAAISLSEAVIYGRRPDIRAIDFLQKLMRDRNDGKDIDNIVLTEMNKYRGIPGYSRPIVNDDERIIPLTNLAQELGYGDMPYISLGFNVQNILIRNKYRMKMNVAALAAAVASDQGLSPIEYYQYLVVCFSGGMFPCFIEATSKVEGGFLPLRCDRIAYEGAPTRNW